MTDPITQFTAQTNFWAFCNYLDPKFYKPNRVYLTKLCNTLQLLYEGKLLDKKGRATRKLMVNLPPRHGKSYTLVNFGQWVLGVSQTNKIFTVCYNENLSSRFSKGVRDGIEFVSLDGVKPAFSDIFKDVRIKKGDGAYQNWALEGQYFTYLGASLGGTITGMGCNIGIIDDVLKNAKEALNDRYLAELYESFYCNTFLSRLEEGAMQIICNTRWATNDLCGKILEKEGDEWHVLTFEAMENEKMLCDEVLSLNSYLNKKSLIVNEIFMANYHQQPMDAVGRMYAGQWKYYKELPKDLAINCYVDTADTGNDYFCGIIFGENKLKDLYLIDVIYTKEAMETTRELLANKLIEHKVSRCKIESNNGGRIFAENVEKIYRSKGGNLISKIEKFHQTNNKETRIFVNSASVQNKFFMPENIAGKHIEFWKTICLYKREGKNENDDAPDALTGCIEMVQKQSWVI